MNISYFFSFKGIYTYRNSLILIKGGHTHPTNSSFSLKTHILEVKS